MRHLPPLLLALLVAVLAVLPLAPASAGDPPGLATVPDGVGLDLEEAQALAQQAGFSTSAIFGGAGTPGSVVAQEPGGLALRPPGGLITFTVAGADSGATAMPPLAPPLPPAGGFPPVEPPAEAPALPPQTPPDANLPPPAVKPPFEPPPVAPPLETPPSPGTATPAPGPRSPGMDLSTLPEEPRQDTAGPAVPTLTGIRREKLRPLVGPWMVSMQFTLTTPESDGLVLEQDPPPGTTLAKGATVTVVLGTTTAPSPDHRQVPAVTGQSVEEALAALQAAGFDARLSARAGPESDRGRVLKQMPQRYCFALPSRPVQLVVGR